MKSKTVLELGRKNLQLSKAFRTILGLGAKLLLKLCFQILSYLTDTVLLIMNNKNPQNMNMNTAMIKKCTFKTCSSHVYLLTKRLELADISVTNINSWLWTMINLLW